MSRVRTRAGALLLGVSALVIGVPASAQQLTLKRNLPTVPAAGCPVLPLPPAATTEERVQAAGLAAQGNQAALLGENEQAATLLARAAALDPQDYDIAYRLARARDESGDRVGAVREYCRYLTLAPRGADAADVRERVAALPASPEGSRWDRVADQFRTGLQLADGGNLERAEQAFAGALRDAPDLAVGFYNRGMVRAARGNSRGAVEDLNRYLANQPAASDREEVQRRIAIISRAEAPRMAASSPRVPPDRRRAVPVGSLVVPGMGQFLTGRPVLGALVLGGVGAAAYFAVQTEDVTRIQTYRTPFGVEYQDEVTVRERPNLLAGLAVAAAITAVGAVEAFTYSRRGGQRSAAGEDGRSLSAGPVVDAEADGIRMGVEIRAGI